MPRPIVTLTTDFGLQDHFAGVLKGVILSIAPTSEIVDITHDVNPFEISEGGFVIAEAYRYFPKKTIHLVVVDPGVGSQRRPLLVQGGGYSFVAPDNGVLSTILAKEKCTVREITKERYFLKPVSKTFQGRDVFAPVAGHLAKGVTAAMFGKKIDDALRLAPPAVQRIGKRAWAGTILKIDRFGNIITNFHREEFPTVGEQNFEMTVGLERTSVFARTYSDVPFGVLSVIVGSSGYLEVAFKQANAAKALGVGVGAPLELHLL
jgi:S-adenosylmethionine hydrolase